MSETQNRSHVAKGLALYNGMLCSYNSSHLTSSYLTLTVSYAL